jgi:hypothetical protein
MENEGAMFRFDGKNYTKHNLDGKTDPEVKD